MVLISIATLGSSAKITIPIRYKTMFNSIIVPPIRKSITGANTKITVEATIVKKDTIRYSTAYVSNGNGLSVLLHREDFIGVEERKTFSFEYDTFYGTDVFFMFEIIEDNVITKSTTIFPSFITYERHEIEESTELTTSSPAKSYVLGSVKNQYETIKFTGFDGLYGRTMGCFDLHTYKIESILCGKNNSLQISQCGLFISDKNSFFSNVGKTTMTITELPMKLVEEETGIYHLELANQIFINPENLLMSNIRYIGWIPTKRYIYLPKNCKEQIKGSSMSFYFNDLGINSAHVSNTFSLDGINNDFGYCQNSKYCVKTEETLYSSLKE